MSEQERKKYFDIKTKAINEDEGTADVVMSDESLDRDNEVILTTAHINFLQSADAKRMPLLRDHRAGTNETLGRVDDMRIEDKELLGKAVYFINEEKQIEGKFDAQWAFALVKNGLGKYSVRFIPKKFVIGEEVEGNEAIPQEVQDMKPDAVFTEVDLVELSQVVIPANRNAVARHLDSLDTDYEKEIVEEMVSKAYDKNLYVPKKYIIVPDFLSDQTQYLKIDSELNVEKVDSVNVEKGDNIYVTDVVNGENVKEVRKNGGLIYPYSNEVFKNFKDTKELEDFVKEHLDDGADPNNNTKSESTNPSKEGDDLGDLDIDFSEVDGVLDKIKEVNKEDDDLDGLDLDTPINKTTEILKELNDEEGENPYDNMFD